jgi:hypothetical protein
VLRIPTVKVFYEPNHETASYVDEDTAALTFAGVRAGVGMWHLSYPEPPRPGATLGVDVYPIAGDLTDVDEVVTSAEDHLRRVYHEES